MRDTLASSPEDASNPTPFSSTLMQDKDFKSFVDSEKPLHTLIKMAHSGKLKSGEFETLLLVISMLQDELDVTVCTQLQDTTQLLDLSYQYHFRTEPMNTTTSLTVKTFENLKKQFALPEGYNLPLQFSYPPGMNIPDLSKQLVGSNAFFPLDSTKHERQFTCVPPGLYLALSLLFFGSERIIYPQSQMGSTGPGFPTNSLKPTDIMCSLRVGTRPVAVIINGAPKLSDKLHNASLSKKQLNRTLAMLYDYYHIRQNIVVNQNVIDAFRIIERLGTMLCTPINWGLYKSSLHETLSRATWTLIESDTTLNADYVRDAMPINADRSSVKTNTGALEFLVGLMKRGITADQPGIRGCEFTTGFDAWAQTQDPNTVRKYRSMLLYPANETLYRTTNSTTPMLTPLGTLFFFEMALNPDYWRENFKLDGNHFQTEGFTLGYTIMQFLAEKWPIVKAISERTNRSKLPTNKSKEYTINFLHMSPFAYHSGEILVLNGKDGFFPGQFINH